MIIYSRFNCRQYVIETNPSPQVSMKDVRRAKRRMDEMRFHEPWLVERMRLFETYTLPSVLAQTNQNFRWIVIVHPDTSPWFVKKLRTFPKLEVRQFEWDIDAKEPGHHTTINLDTDDALARDFIVEARMIDFQGETIFERGMKYREFTDCWIGTRMPNGHFNMVQHPEMTVLDFSHGMGPLNKQVLDHRRPMWLEVIHEGNIANMIRTSKKDGNMGEEHASQYFELDRKGIALQKEYNLTVKKYGRSTNTPPDEPV